MLQLPATFTYDIYLRHLPMRSLEARRGIFEKVVQALEFSTEYLKLVLDI